MGTQHLTDALIRGLPAPAKGNAITYDDTVIGLGIRVTAAGHKAFILGYSVRGSGRQRRYTIGSFPDWNATAARDRAKELKRQIDTGGDPLADIEAEREAPTVADLIERFRKEHVAVRLRPAVAADYERMIRDHVLGHLSEKTKVADVAFEDIDKLHRSISKAAPYRANRTVTLLSKMFSLSIKWKMRTDNPAKGIERNNEDARERYLSMDELVRLSAALDTFHDQQTANIIRLFASRRGGEGTMDRP